MTAKNDDECKGFAPKAVIFDLDGTLIESTVNFQEFRRRLLEFVGLKGADMDRYSMRETTVAMISRFEEEMRANGVSDKTMEEWLDEIDCFLDEIEMVDVGKTRPIDGAREALSELKSGGVRIGILTRSCPRYARSALAIAGLDGYADEIIARDRRSGVPPKPDPRSALVLIERMGIKPEDTVMIGDYSIDFLCAKNAGIRFFGLASDEDSRISLEQAGCGDLVLSLNEFLKRIRC